MNLDELKELTALRAKVVRCEALEKEWSRLDCRSHDGTLYAKELAEALADPPPEKGLHKPSREAKIISLVRMVAVDGSKAGVVIDELMALLESEAARAESDG